MSTVLTSDKLLSDPTTSQLLYEPESNRLVYAVLDFHKKSTAYRQDIAMSRTGRYQLLGGANSGATPLQSSDFGETWQEVEGIPSGYVSMSRSGEHRLIGFYSASFYAPFWVSNDYGETWTSKTVGGANYRGSMRSCILDGGAKMMILCHVLGLANSRGLYESSDYGDTWTLRYELPLGTYFEVASNESGDMTLLAENWPFDPPARHIFKGSFGSAVYTSILSNTTRDYRDVNLTKSGKHIIASDSHNLHLSNDYGADFTSIAFTSSQTFKNAGGTVAISDTGQFQIIGITDNTSGRRLAMSYDYGQNWAQLESTVGVGAVGTVDISGTGKYITVLSNTGVWTSHFYGL
jgi:hypothetical protein